MEPHTTAAPNSYTSRINQKLHAHFKSSRRENEKKISILGYNFTKCDTEDEVCRLFNPLPVFVVGLILTTFFVLGVVIGPIAAFKQIPVLFLSNWLFGVFEVTMILWAYMKVMKTSPGIVPIEWDLLQNEKTALEEEVSKQTNAIIAKQQNSSIVTPNIFCCCCVKSLIFAENSISTFIMQLLKNFESSKVLKKVSNSSKICINSEQERQFLYSLEMNENLKPRFCKACGNVKPPRAHHSRILKKCVMRMDHYCIWVDNVIGLKNHKFFWQFLFYASLGLCHYFICAGILLLLLVFQVKNLDFYGRLTNNLSAVAGDNLKQFENSENLKGSAEIINFFVFFKTVFSAIENLKPLLLALLILYSIFMFPLLLMCGGFFIWQTYLMVINQTQVENHINSVIMQKIESDRYYYEKILRRNQKNLMKNNAKNDAQSQKIQEKLRNLNYSHIYNVNWLTNMKTVLGDNPWHWLIPIDYQNERIDGVHYPVISEPQLGISRTLYSESQASYISSSDDSDDSDDSEARPDEISVEPEIELEEENLNLQPGVVSEKKKTIKKRQIQKKNKKDKKTSILDMGLYEDVYSESSSDEGVVETQLQETKNLLERLSNFR